MWQATWQVTWQLLFVEYLSSSHMLSLIKLSSVNSTGYEPGKLLAKPLLPPRLSDLQSLIPISRLAHISLCHCRRHVFDYRKGFTQKWEHRPFGWKYQLQDMEVLDEDGPHGQGFMGDS